MTTKNLKKKENLDFFNTALFLYNFYNRSCYDNKNFGIPCQSVSVLKISNIYFPKYRK